jgi:asparaginyl-tRNA synthetase
VQSNTPGFESLKNPNVNIHSSVFIVGTLSESPAKEQRVELDAEEVRVLGPADPTTYPISQKFHSVEFLRSQGHFRPRTKLISAITKVRNSLAWATHSFFQQRGFYYLNTPLITASDCEGAGEMFQITTLFRDNADTPSKIKKVGGTVDYTEDFFKKKAFLTVSGQLNAEIYACAIGNVYTFGPTFRAEDAHTARHLAEFWMIEPEMAFADLQEDMDVAEQYVKYTLGYVLTHNIEELTYLESYEKKILEERLGAQKTEEKGKKQKPTKETRDFRFQSLIERIKHVASSDFARISYTEAIKLLLEVKDHTFEMPVSWGIDLASEHDRYLAEKKFLRPVIVYNYPKDIKAFYMRLNEDKKTVAAMDVLVPGVGELIGGSQREERLDILIERMKECNLDPEGYQWYLDLRRYGSVPHAGFGLGFERLVCYTTGVENIREAIPFPRYPEHADF